MNSLSRYISLALLLAVFAFMFGAGCSNENPTGSFDYSQAVFTSPLPEATFVETFDKRSNVGNWSFFGNPDVRAEIIEMNDGNPGAFLHATCGQWGCLDTYAPQFRTQVGVSSIFTGNYREKNVTAVGIDIAIFGPEYVTTGGRPVSLVLRNDNGTPDDYSDDIRVFWVGNKGLPMPTGMFKTYQLAIPSQSTTMPKDWGVLGSYGTGDADADWNTVMNDVSQITFFFGNPEMFFIFQQWDIGVDNICIWCE